jgi:HD-GYP domain-containing protein (c-di-GMP phosphodiesterase class II)
VLVVAVDRLDPYILLAAVLPLLLAWFGQKQYLDRSRRGVEELRDSNARLGEANDALHELVAAKSQLLTEKSDLLERVRLSYLQTVASLARTIEAKDPYTGGHTERVSDYALMIARELHFSTEELRAVETGGVIHDIGKIGVRDEILLKPGRLNAEEWAEMRRHPEISSYILGELGLPEIAKDMARSHHERFDGDGYPDGLVGEAIPLAARVLSVADTLDAMTSDRPYRSRRRFDEALEELRRNAGSQFCPRVVAALLASYERDPGKWQRDTSVPFVAAVDV